MFGHMFKIVQAGSSPTAIGYSSCKSPVSACSLGRLHMRNSEELSSGCRQTPNGCVWGLPQRGLPSDPPVLGHCQEAHGHFQPFLSPDGQGHLLWRIQPRPWIGAQGVDLLTESLDWCWREKGANRSLGPASPYVQTDVDPAISQPPPTKTVWPGDGRVVGVPVGPCSGALPAPESHPWPLKPLLCLPSPQRRASAFLGPRPHPRPSCPAARWAVWKAAPSPAWPTHSSCQVTQGCPRDDMGGGTPFPGIQPLLPAVLQERSPT